MGGHLPTVVLSSIDVLKDNGISLHFMRWVSYVRHLTEKLLNLKQTPPPHRLRQAEPFEDQAIQTGSEGDTPPSHGAQVSLLAEQLLSVVQRATRNCPGSLPIVEQHLLVHWTLAKVGYTILDPDVLLNVSEQALDTGFLPAEWQLLKVYLTAIRLVKQRVLMLLTPRLSSRQLANAIEYDDAEAPPKDAAADTKATVSDAALEEAYDLADDFRDMYELVDQRIQKSFPKWSAGRSMLWRDRALTSHLLLDNMLLLQEQPSALSPSGIGRGSDACHWFEKAVRVSNPPHPDSYRSWILSFAGLGSSIRRPSDVARHVRHVRFLYQQAIKCVGRSSSNDGVTIESPEASSSRGFDAALQSLCQEWLEFEHVVGSDRSIGRAVRAIQNKARKTQSTAATSRGAIGGGVFDATGQKRKLVVARDDSGKQPAKRAMLAQGSTPSIATANTVESQTGSQPYPSKIKIGKLEYPPHPFTIRVSFLSQESDDMDIVELLRPKCGDIAHARIIREKTPPYRSKGWGLVQFEEASSVARALALNDVLGLHGKVLRFERWHQPAVPLVPPGRHRVSEKGHGKHSKRNERKQREEGFVNIQGKGAQRPSPSHSGTGSTNHLETVTNESRQPNATDSSHPPELASLYPRGVFRQTRKKPRLNLS